MMDQSAHPATAASRYANRLLHFNPQCANKSGFPWCTRTSTIVSSFNFLSGTSLRYHLSLKIYINIFVVGAIAPARFGFRLGNAAGV
jgi:hypothetical protein